MGSLIKWVPETSRQGERVFDVRDLTGLVEVVDDRHGCVCMDGQEVSG